MHGLCGKSMKSNHCGYVGWTVCALGAALAILQTDCQEPRGPLSVKSDDPTLAIPAIKQDVQKHDTNDIPRMVKDLNDDDPAIRFYAIEGLFRLTGDTFGYYYYNDENQRRPALNRWKLWLKERGGK